MGQSGTYFNAEGTLVPQKKGVVVGKVRPTIEAALQNAGVFADASILFDWTAFQVPKGTSKLISVIAIVRGTDGVAQGALPIDLIFAKSINCEAPPSLGTKRAAVTTFNWSNHIIGFHPIVADDYSDADLITLRIAKTNVDDMVLSPEPCSGTNVGYDTIYVAGIAKAQFDFRGTVEVKTTRDAAAIAAGTTKQLELTAKSALINFSIGDVLRDEDELVLGEIKSIEGTDDLTFLDQTVGTDISGVHTDGKKVYNIHPISLIFGFER
jgi:hypothetical protein